MDFFQQLPALVLMANSCLEKEERFNESQASRNLFQNNFIGETAELFEKVFTYIVVQITRPVYANLKNQRFLGNFISTALKTGG